MCAACPADARRGVFVSWCGPPRQRCSSPPACTWFIAQGRKTSPRSSRGWPPKKLLNLNALAAREELLPALSVDPRPRDAQEAARKIYYLSGGLPQRGRDSQRSLPANSSAR